jgi:hypothetical protein
MVNANEQPSVIEAVIALVEQLMPAASLVA